MTFEDRLTDPGEPVICATLEEAIAQQIENELAAGGDADELLEYLSENDG